MPDEGLEPPRQDEILGRGSEGGERVLDAPRACDGGGEVDLDAHARAMRRGRLRSEEHTSELQSRRNLVCRLLLEKKHKHPTS